MRCRGAECPAAPLEWQIAGAGDLDGDGALDLVVTSVGGTQLKLDDSGNKLSPDVVWNDGFGAGGGGVSDSRTKVADSRRAKVASPMIASSSSVSYADGDRSPKLDP